jgi:hypothetical protein
LSHTFTRILFLSLLLLSLTACSALDVAKEVAKSAVLGPQSGLEVDANVGQAKTEGDDSVAQNANTAVSVGGGTKGVYEGAVEQVVNEAGLEWHELLLLVLLAGWAIPSPAEMFLGVARTGRNFWLTVTGKLPL